MDFSLILCGEKNFYRTAIYICGEIKNQIKNNEGYNGTKIGNYFENGLK